MHHDTQLVRQVVMLRLITFSAPASAGARSTPSTSSSASSPSAAPLRWLLPGDESDLSHTYNKHNTRCSRCAGAVDAACLTARAAPLRAGACGVRADTYGVGGDLWMVPISTRHPCYARSRAQRQPRGAVFQILGKCSSAATGLKATTLSVRCTPRSPPEPPLPAAPHAMLLW